jgi:hypothetical protein
VSNRLSLLLFVRLSRWLLPGWALLLVSCTLTGGDYEPTDVDALPVRAAAPGCAGGAQCCPSAPCGAELACRDGRCEPASTSSGPDAGACLGVDCSPPEAEVPEVLTPGSFAPEAMEAAPTAFSCEDQQQNGDETGLDCGGSCGACADGAGCSDDDDCQSGRCAMGRCAAASCDDGVQNGDEPSVDCGGPCRSCPSGRACSEPDGCQSGVCSSGGCADGIAQCCQAATCNDGVANADESDVDCGAQCPSCATGRVCNGPNDCESGVCSSADCPGGAEQCCQAPSCSDGVQNGNEPVVDCGNAACGLCAVDSDCTEDAQCADGFCDRGRCADPGTCTDGALNGRETATDCGGGTCPRCADRLSCTVPDDCINDNCFNEVCISCGSGVIDGTETDIDCGGADPFCRRCDPGRRCLVNGDCASGFCNNGFC